MRGVFLVKSLQRQGLDDPRSAFVKRVDLSKTRVRAFDGFVLLCGGKQEVDLLPVRSLRHMLYGEMTSGKYPDLAVRLKLAEEIQDWFQDGLYKDLVTFEEHLAGLSAVIVLVVESAGAIAELGVFSVSKAFTDRVLVLVSEHHYEEDSFIKLGPLRRLEGENEKSVLVYDWHASDEARTEDFEKVRGDLPEIIDAIAAYTHTDIGEQVFRRDGEAHVMLLMCELCHLFGALSQTELSAYLTEMGLGVNERQVAQYLFVLSKCGLIGVKSKGHGRYYFAIEWRSRITFAYHPGAAINRERLETDVVVYYATCMTARFDVVRKIRAA